MSAHLNLVGVYQNDAMLKRVFSWLSRIGAGPKFGSRPIGWYQMHQCAAIDILLSMNIWEPCCRGGLITDRVKVSPSISPNQLFDKADARSRAT